MNDSAKINLIYIASIGRSGSTLLESMLGAHSRIATMGELHIWPHELRQNGVRPCSCGEYVQTCPFWSEMRRRVDPLKQEGPGLDYFREKHNAGHTLRLRRLGGFRTGKPMSAEEAADIERYGKNNDEVFRAFLDVSEEMLGDRPEWIVDASKDPYRLLWLHLSGLFNIKVIHLVKNPRAFVYSVTKDLIGESGGVAASRRQYFTARQSVAWSIQNRLFSKLGEVAFDSASYMLVNYETLATEPKKTFEKVCRLIGCEYEEQAVDNFRSGSVHTIAGNPMRYESKGIVLDEKWKMKLPASSRKLTEILTSRIMTRYGYH